MADNYEVGYGKPPKRTQFKAGQSGNPKGRPKGKKNLRTELLEELGEVIALREQGKTKKISKLRGILKSHVAKAIKGDARSANIIFGLLAGALQEGPGEAIPEDLLEVDKAILESFKKALLDGKDNIE